MTSCNYIVHNGATTSTAIRRTSYDHIRLRHKNKLYSIFITAQPVAWRQSAVLALWRVVVSTWWTLVISIVHAGWDWWELQSNDFCRAPHRQLLYYGVIISSEAFFSKDRLTLGFTLGYGHCFVCRTKDTLGDYPSRNFSSQPGGSWGTLDLIC